MLYSLVQIRNILLLLFLQILYDFMQIWFNMTSATLFELNFCGPLAYVVLGSTLYANTTSAIKLTSAHLITPQSTYCSAIMQF